MRTGVTHRGQEHLNYCLKPEPPSLSGNASQGVFALLQNPVRAGFATALKILTEGVSQRMWHLNHVLEVFLGQTAKARFCQVKEAGGKGMIMLMGMALVVWEDLEGPYVPWSRAWIH